jgi:hypothetical protein
MSSGITQLIAIGAQDVHITGDPQVTFFQSTYKRYTNFAMFSAEQIMKGNPAPGGMSMVEIDKSGDLLSYIYLVAYDSANNTPVNITGGWDNVIESAELLISGQVVDTQNGLLPIFCLRHFRRAEPAATIREVPTTRNFTRSGSFSARAGSTSSLSWQCRTAPSKCASTGKTRRVTSSDFSRNTFPLTRRSATISSKRASRRS